ncbi:MAG TPA: YetF domain-containing protein [Candidatus Dormibacteraeota bacterium]|nr:YetF domain-containing protein [Candidatus Dormibacteraeota bacterium]
MLEAPQILRDALGLSSEPKDLSFLQVGLRASIVFIVALIIARIGNRRFLARLTVFDAVLAFILGSMLSRAVNGSAAFFPTLFGGVVIVLMHRIMANMACRWHWFSKLIKGCHVVLIQDGKLLPEPMQHDNLTEDDVIEELRLNGNMEKIEEVKKAVIERSGQISVVKK